MSDSETRVHFRVIRFIFEAGLKLHLQGVPLATASTIYQKFFRANRLQEYDPFLIGAACLSLACKIEEESVRLRDIVNVCYRTLHKNKAPLEIGDTYWSLRESVARCELYLLRALEFKVQFDHPHKDLLGYAIFIDNIHVDNRGYTYARYLCHYLKSVSQWMEPNVWEDVPIARTAWSYLRDSYHTDLCLDHSPEHIAVAVLYFSLLCHGTEIPFHKHTRKKWWQAFSSDITLAIIQTIVSKIITAYDVENQLPR